MQNIVFLIGRLVSDPEIKKSENERDYTTITLAVQRPYKNTDGLYESDFIRCKLWNGIATSVGEYCHKGDLIGIKGRIQIRTYEDNEETKYVTEIIAEKVTFLSSKRQEEAE